jgi:flagellum-specific ATP synthase
MTGSIALWQPEARHDVLNSLRHIRPFPILGRVNKVLGPMVEVGGMRSSIGSACDIYVSKGQCIEAEIVGFRDDNSILMPVGRVRGITPGDVVRPRPTPPGIHVGEYLLGRILDGRGQAMDNRPLTPAGPFHALHGTPLNPCDRHIIDTPMQSGIRVLDACLTMGWGQRMGLFAGAGIGKSTLMGMMARNSDADINVIALIGERSREVREFLEHSLGAAALERSIVIVATSDAPPVLRIRAALLAATIAEFFQNQEKQVFLMMDSLTRFAQAQREIGLMLGEPPASKGYTPSCFSAMAELLERAGPGTGQGNITGLYTVLVEGDDIAGDPVADAALAILDGHAVLDRELAERGHYPAINVLKSVSRLANSLSGQDVQKAARSLRKELALFARMEDMINMGAYEHGSNPELDRVIARMPAVRAFLQQEQNDASNREDTCRQLIQLMKEE